MFSKATVSKCVIVLVAVAVFARATRFQGLASSEQATAHLVSTNRDKTGTSQGRERYGVLQTTPPAVLTAGGSFGTERGGFEPP